MEEAKQFKPLDDEMDCLRSFGLQKTHQHIMMR